MFDREKQIVINRYCRAIFHERENISISELNHLNIPQQILHFINCEIDNQINNEFNEIKKFSKFDYDNIRVNPLIDELKILLRLTRKLNYDELSLLFKLALDLTLDYLIRPCETLTSFVFKYEETQFTSTILERLKYIKDYEYFPILTKAYLEKRKIPRINRNNFIDLLRKIENEYTRDFTLLEHYQLFNSFKSYLLELNLYITDLPEYEAFIVYLKDKNQMKFAEFLEEHKDHFKSVGMNFPNYLKSLTHVPEVNEKIFKQDVEIVEGFKGTDQSSVPGVAREENISDVNAEVLTETSIINEQKADESESKISDLAKPELQEEKPVSLIEKLTRPEVTFESKTFDRNLDGLMPRNLKKKVIKNIFDDNEMEFAEFINDLNKVKNWDEASLLLTDLFDKKNIQPFSKWAIKFTEFLYENIK